MEDSTTSPSSSSENAFNTNENELDPVYYSLSKTTQVLNFFNNSLLESEDDVDIVSYSSRNKAEFLGKVLEKVVLGNMECRTGIHNDPMVMTKPASSWSEMVFSADVFVHQTCHFVKSIPEFNQLNFGDKVTLLREQIPSIVNSLFMLPYDAESGTLTYVINDQIVSSQPHVRVLELSKKFPEYADLNMSREYTESLMTVTASDPTILAIYNVMKFFRICYPGMKEKIGEILSAFCQEKFDMYSMILLQMVIIKFGQDDCDWRYNRLLEILTWSEKFDVAVYQVVNNISLQSLSLPPMVQDIFNCAERK